MIVTLAPADEAGWRPALVHHSVDEPALIPSGTLRRVSDTTGTVPRESPLLGPTDANRWAAQELGRPRLLASLTDTHPDGPCPYRSLQTRSGTLASFGR